MKIINNKNMNDADIEKKCIDFELKISQANTIEQKVRAYLDYRNYLSIIDPKKSIELMDEAIAIVEKTSSKSELYKLYYSKANSLIHIKKIEEGFLLMSKCLEYNLKKNDKIQLGLIYLSFSNIFYKLTLFKTSIFLKHYVIKNFFNPNDKERTYAIYTNIMSVYFISLNINKFEESFILNIVDYYKDKKDKNLIGYIISKLNLARYYRLNNDLNKSLEIYNEMLHLCFVSKNYASAMDIHYELGLMYKDQKNWAKAEYHFYEAYKINQKEYIHYHNLALYEELYTLYKKDQNSKKALEFLEVFNQKEIEFEKEKEEILSQLKKIGFEKVINDDALIVKDYFEKIAFENQNILLEENVKGEVVKINIDEVVYVSKTEEFLQVCFVNGKKIHLKTLYKNFIQKMVTKLNGMGMFFETNARNQTVNLFWLSRFEDQTKEIVLKVIQEEYTFSVSKRQFPLLKKIIES